uniref:J domain-containing protein n=1 Tax=Oryza punctata TaxID=4537 RepID=A0A0E0L1U9_ORYPU
MTPAVAAPIPHPTRQNPSGTPQQPTPAASMGNPNLGLGLASSDHTAAAAPPPSRRAPRLAKRRHAAASSSSSRSRQPPPASPSAAPWNPFGGGGGGGADGAGKDGIGEIAPGGVGVATNGGFVFGGAAPATSQQPPVASSSGEAPFVFGSVRDSLPRFDEGWSASAKLPEKMGRMNLQTPGESSANVKKDGSSIFGVDIPGLVANSEVNVLPEKLTELNLGSGVPLQGDNGVPKTFVFGGNESGHFTDGKSADASPAGSYASSSVNSAKENGVPEKPTQFSIGNQAPLGRMGTESTKGAPPVFMFGGNTSSDHVDRTNANPSGTFNDTDGTGLRPEKITQLNTGSSVPFQQKESGGSSQADAFVFGSTSDEGGVFFSAGNSDAFVPPSSVNNLPPELSSCLNIGGGVTQSKQSDNSGYPSEAFVFGSNASLSSHSSKKVMNDGGNFVTGANSKTFTSVHGNMESTLPEKMTKLNIGHGTPSNNNKDEAAHQPPEVSGFGTNAATTFSSAHAASMPVSSIQTNVSFELKGSGGNSANEDIGKFTDSRSNNDQGYGTSNFVFSSGSTEVSPSEGSAEHALQDEIKKLNINREGTLVGCTEKVNESSTQFVFRSKAEASPVFGAVPQPNVQETCPFTYSNHSSSFSTSSGNGIPPSSFRTTNTVSDTIPGESCAVRQEPAWCSKESLFGIDYIKSAYRDKKEAQKNARKNKRPAKLKHRAQFHQFPSQETCTGLDTDSAGDYSPMDCSPYPATVEQVSKEAKEAPVTSDQSIHIHDSGVANQNPNCAEDIVSATEHLVIDADLPTCEEEGRVPNVGTSVNSFASSFSSFDEEVNIPSSSNMNGAANGKPKSAPPEVWNDAYGYNDQGQAHEENGYRTVHEIGEHATFQASSADFSGLNFSFGASLSPQSSLSTQRRNTRRKVRTKSGHLPKSSATQASVQPKSSLDTKTMQFSPEKHKTGDSTDEQSTRDASASAALETCETWRTSGNQAYANGHFATAEEYYTRGISSVSGHGSSGHFSHALMLCYSNRAATKMYLGRMREALQDCLIATSIDPTFLKAKVRAANCQLALGDLEDAARSYTTCLQSSKTSGSDIKMFAEASDGLERVQRVADWISQSKELLKKRTVPEATMALELISNALNISSHSDKLMEMKAEALLTLRKYEEVIQLCQETVVLAEKNSSASETTECSERLWRTYLICKTYFLSGKLEDALELLNKHQQVTNVKESDGRTSQECFLSLSTTIRELLSHKAAGNEAFQAHRYSEAVEQYSAALACNSDSRPFSAVCFCNRAAAYQALGQVTDAIADCSLAMVLDATYPKAISRRATLYEMIRDYGQAANDLRKLILLLEKQGNRPGLSPKVVNKHNDLKQARVRLLSVEDEAKRDTPLNLYLILGIEPSSSPADIKKAYRKAALRHHPDKAAQLLVRNEKPDDGFWRDVAKEVYADADHLFKAIGEAYNVLSDPDKRQEYDIEESLRNATKRVSKGGRMHRSPEQRYTKQYDRGFNPRPWQSNRSSGSRSRWSGYDDDYW